MAKTLLRSGNLDDFQAVGGGGQAVFESALQIREALRLRKQQAIVDCLAIPQVNDGGDRVDWYSPVDGAVLSWKAADEDDRFRALRYLENTLASVESLSKKCLQSPKTAQQLFGSLLSKAFQFPGENFLFLVDGRPVICFWGFVNLNENARDDVLDCLREALVPEPEPVVIDEPEPEPEPLPAVTFEQADEPLVTPATAVRITEDALYEPEPVRVSSPPVEEPAPVAVPAPKKRRIPLWSLPVAAVVVAAVAAPLLWPKQAPSAAPVAAAPVAVAIAPAPVKSVEPLALTLPLHQADVLAPKAVEPVAASEPVVIAAIPKDAMVMEASQVKAGSTRFLNGTWRALLDVKDPVTGKPPSLRYQIQSNKGTARVVHGDNIVCRVEVFSGLHSNGELMIKTRGNARCTDGSRYPMPEVACKAGTSDVAECSARYDAKTVVPLTFKKAGA